MVKGIFWKIKYKNYVVSYNNKAITFTKNESNCNQLEGENKNIVGLTENEKIKIKQLEKDGKQLIAPKGCVRPLNWDSMGDIADTVTKELKSIPTSDFYLSVLKMWDQMEKEQHNKEYHIL